MSEPPAKKQMLESTMEEMQSDLHEMRAAERKMMRDMAAMRRKEAQFVFRVALKEREQHWVHHCEATAGVIGSLAHLPQHH